MSIAVSVLCTTYNQEKYISRALDSIIAQRTSFEYEILVNDDCSSDNTASIVREYTMRYPALIKPVFHEENLYSKGISPERFLFPLAQGKYVAFCEGDDYWTDDAKLQKQFEALEGDLSLSAAAHANINVNAATESTESCTEPFTQDGVYGLDYFIGQSRIPPFATASLFVRSSIFGDYLKSGLPSLKAHGDFKLQLYCAVKGNFAYSSSCMSAYRMLADGSINRSIMLDNDWIEVERGLNRDRQEALGYISDRFASEAQRVTLRDLSKRLEYLCALNSDDYDLLRKRYPREFSREAFARRAKIFIYSKLPSLHLYIRKHRAR